jgi:hypothetical protein
MTFIFYAVLVLLTLYNVFLSAIPVLSGEVNFFNDVARDFLIFQEIDYKKIIFIGGRSNTTGLFHGPLWHYMNYPAYLLGHGDPVIVAWFWVFLGVIFLVSSFFLAKKLFGTFPALVYILITAVRMPLHLNGVFQSGASFFFMPFFFFTITMYFKTKKNLYLALHFLALSILIQLNIGTGLQLFLLSIPLTLYIIIKKKLWKHLYSFLVLPLCLANFILFDLRNNLRMSKALFSTGEASKFFVPINSWLENRFNNAVSLKLLEVDNGNGLFNFLVFGLVVIFSIVQIKNKSKDRYTSILFLFYYFGYILLSFFNKGILLEHYTYLLVPLTTFWLISFLAGKYKLLFMPFIAFLFIINFTFVKESMNPKTWNLGNSPDSWKGLHAVALEVAKEQKGEEFGYYVFAPDGFAYQPRYAMLYTFKEARAHSFEYSKKPTTYIIAAPPPKEDPYMTYVWWRKNSVRIQSSPVFVKKFPNGFTIEKYYLTPEEQRIQHDKTIELGIHFR